MRTGAGPVRTSPSLATPVRGLVATIFAGAIKEES